MVWYSVVTTYVPYPFTVHNNGYWSYNKSHVDNGLAILRYNDVFTKVSSHAQTKYTILEDNVSTCQKCHILLSSMNEATFLSTK